MCYEFVWNKKPDKINRKTVHKIVQEGGLGLPYLKTFISALKLTWIRKFINTNHKWKNITLARNPFIKNIERCGPRVANAYSKCNAFWTQVFKAEFHNKLKLTNAGEVFSEPICFNQRIRVRNTFLMHKHWIDKGVYCIARFLNEEGKKLINKQKNNNLSHIDFQRKFDITIDFVTYSCCKLAIKKFLRNSGFKFCNNNVMNHTASLKKLYETNKGWKL